MSYESSFWIVQSLTESNTYFIFRQLSAGSVREIKIQNNGRIIVGSQYLNQREKKFVFSVLFPEMKTDNDN